jgi:hypothetical protein
MRKRTCHAMWAAIAWSILSVPTVSADDALVTAGIGLQTCSKLTTMMKPSEGLDNQGNYLVYYWVQGYMSAANITTLESDGNYVDLHAYDDTKIIPLVYDFCTKNPDKKPISAIDDLLGSAPRLKGDWPKGTIGWAAEEKK